ncbi:MAG: hypothetical protein ACRDFB_03230 [Rhabdochlamydiaceae bacterium]
MEYEKKIWTPGSEKEKKFRSELVRMAERHGVGTMVCIYVRYEEPKEGKMMVVGQPSAQWLDACWQRLRLFASDLITKGKVR